MKQTELMNHLLAGGAVAVGEYRAMTVDTITFSTDGQAKKSEIRKHTVEVGAMPCVLGEWPERGTASFPPNVPPPAKKGQRVVILLEQFIVKRGIGDLRGKIVPLAD